MHSRAALAGADGAVQVLAAEGLLLLSAGQRHELGVQASMSDASRPLIIKLCNHSLQLPL